MTTTPQQASDELALAGADSLVHLIRALADQADLDSLLLCVAHMLTASIDGAEAAAVSLVRHQQLRFGAATSAPARDLEQRQVTDGPAVAVALHGRPTVAVADWTSESCWPVLAERALHAGFRSLRTYPMSARGRTIAVATVHGCAPDAFGPGTDKWALDLLVPCTTALRAAQIEADLRSALASRDVIGQAKGILMERFKIGADEAFSLLVAASQNTHRKLHDVADQFIRTGEFVAVR